VDALSKDSSAEFGERMQRMRAIREEQTSRISAILSDEQRAKYQKDMERKAHDHDDGGPPTDHLRAEIKGSDHPLRKGSSIGAASEEAAYYLLAFNRQIFLCWLTRSRSSIESHLFRRSTLRLHA